VRAHKGRAEAFGGIGWIAARVVGVNDIWNNSSAPGQGNE